MKDKMLIKTHNSPVSASELADELEMHGIEYEFAETGLWVDRSDYDYADEVLMELEAMEMEREDNEF